MLKTTSTTEVGGFEAFQTFHALKLHFTTKSYDYVKYHGKTSVSKDSFAIRKDKYHFYRISRKYTKDEIFGFFLSNLIKNPKVWSGELVEEDAHDTFLQWQKRQQSMSYIFTNEVDSLFEMVNDPNMTIKVVDGQYPILYNAYLRGKVSLETILILDGILGFLPMWKKKVSDTVVFPEFITVCEKYKPFVSFDAEKMIKIVKAKL